jgi:hypothetical protein
MTFVLTAGPEVEFADVLFALSEFVEQLAHAHTATMTRTTLEIRTSWDGISQGLVDSALSECCAVPSDRLYFDPSPGRQHQERGGGLRYMYTTGHRPPLVGHLWTLPIIGKLDYGWDSGRCHSSSAAAEVL